MSKELEALKTIKNFLGYNYCSVDLPNELKCVERALQRLEAIDNANPSEALKCLENICEILNEKRIDIKWLFKYEYNTIKQALIKAQEQDFNYKNIVIPFFDELVDVLGTNDTDEMLEKIKEQEKVLSIIKKKNVDVGYLRNCDNVEEYNLYISNYDNNYWKKQPLIKEEFDLLKRWLYD